MPPSLAPARSSRRLPFLAARLLVGAVVAVGGSLLLGEAADALETPGPLDRVVGAGDGPTTLVTEAAGPLPPADAEPPAVPTLDRSSRASVRRSTASSNWSARRSTASPIRSPAVPTISTSAASPSAPARLVRHHRLGGRRLHGHAHRARVDGSEQVVLFVGGRSSLG